MENETTKPRPGPKPADLERDGWLAHLADWLSAPVGPGHTNADRVSFGSLEKAAGVTAGALSRWRKKGARQKLTRDQYLRLCPWLAVWYGYEPPTNQYQFL